MRESLLGFAVLAALMLLGQLARRRSRPRTRPGDAPPGTGPLVLRPQRRNAVMFGITALVPAALLGALTYRWWAAGRAGLADLLAGGLATALVLAFAAHQLARAARARVVVHDTGLERFGVYRRRLVGWGSIAKIAFNPAQQWFFLTISDGSHLWLPADVVGMREFARLALRRLPPAVLRADPRAREVLRELAGVVAEEGARRSR